MDIPLEVVVVSSNLEIRQDVAEMVFRLGIDPICVSSVSQCREIPRREDIGLVFCDRKMKDGNYRDVLWAFASTVLDRSPKVVMISDLDSPGEYEQARRDGLFDVISSPSKPTDIEWMVILAKRANSQVKDLLETSHNLPQLRRTARVGA